MVGSIVQRGLAILLLPVLTRILAIEEFGLAGIATAIGALLATLCSFGLGLTIVRLYYDAAADDTRTTWAALLRLQALASAGIAVVLLALGPLWSRALADFGWNPAFQIAVAFGWFSGLQLTVQGVLRAAHRPGAFLVVFMVQLIIGSGLGVVLAVEHGAAGYLGGMTIGAAASLLVGVPLTYHRPLWDWNLIRQAVRFSIPVVVHQLSGWILEFSDRVLIAIALGAAAVGQYQVAYVAGSALTIVLTSLQQAWSPYYMSMPDERKATIATSLSIPVSVAAFWLGLGLVAAAPAIVSVLAPDEYGHATLVIALVAAATMPRAVYYLTAVVLVDRKRTGRIAIATGAGVPVAIGINAALLPVIGLPAAGWATIASISLMAVMVLLAVRKIVQGEVALPALLVTWSAGTAILCLVAQVPDTTSWIGLRIALVALAVVGATVAIRRLRLESHPEIPLSVPTLHG